MQKCVAAHAPHLHSISRHFIVHSPFPCANEYTSIIYHSLRESYFGIGLSAMQRWRMGVAPTHSSALRRISTPSHVLVHEITA